MAFGKPGSDDSSSKIVPNTPPQGLGLTTNPTSGSLGAFLGNGSRVMGQLAFSGPVEIDGQVEGEIAAQDKLTIGESAMIKGTVHGGEILVKGTVQGDIIASKRLTLKKPARIIGNITAPSLTIEEGVSFDGKCSMNAQGASKGSGKPSEPKLSVATSAVASA